MKTTRMSGSLLVVGALLMCPALAVRADVSLSMGIEMPGISIGINMPTYPELVQMPGYPVYYNPQSASNYFFYDGEYWVYQNNNWYASDWYNGPWDAVDPQEVPVYILRVPVRYYRQPPVYFQRWGYDEPPHWGEYWGHDWEYRRQGWDHWDRREQPRPAPLPVYQRDYDREHYPQRAQQQELRAHNYQYQPHDPVSQHLQRHQEERHAQDSGQHVLPAAPRDEHEARPPEGQQHSPQAVPAQRQPASDRHEHGEQQQQPAAGHVPAPPHRQALPAESRQPTSDRGHGQAGQQRAPQQEFRQPDPPQNRPPAQQQPDQQHAQPQQGQPPPQQQRGQGKPEPHRGRPQDQQDQQH